MSLLQVNIPVVHVHLILLLAQEFRDGLRNGDAAVCAAGAAHGDDQPVLALLLIVSASTDTYKDLSATALCVMDVPVIAALNWTPPPQSLVVAGFNGIHICALCESVLTSSFCQVIFLFLPRSKPLLQG